MRIFTISMLVFLSVSTGLNAQDFNEGMRVAIGKCMERYNNGEFANRVQINVCVNAGISDVYGRTLFNFGDIILEHEANNIRIASDADSKKITQAEYQAQLSSEDLQFRASLLRRMNQEVEQTKEQSRQSRRDLQDAFSNTPTRTAPALSQSYMLPPPLTFKPLSNGTNCTTTYFGNQAQTHCQ